MKRCRNCYRKISQQPDRTWVHRRPRGTWTANLLVNKADPSGRQCYPISLSDESRRLTAEPADE